MCSSGRLEPDSEKSRKSMSLYVLPLSVAVPDGRNSDPPLFAVCGCRSSTPRSPSPARPGRPSGPRPPGTPGPARSARTGPGVISSAGAPFWVTSWYVSIDEACESGSARFTGPDRATAGGITATTLPALSFRSTEPPSSVAVSPLSVSGNTHDVPGRRRVQGQRLADPVRGRRLRHVGARQDPRVGHRRPGRRRRHVRRPGQRERHLLRAGGGRQRRQRRVAARGREAHRERVRLLLPAAARAPHQGRRRSAPTIPDAVW